MRGSLLSFLVIGVITLCGCATIIDGTTQEITIDSNPQGATVYVTTIKDGVLGPKTEAGQTPLTVLVPRKDGAIIVEKEGYQSQQVELVRGMNPWVFGDVLMTSLLSTSIDTSTGASNEYDPDQYFVELKAE